MFALRDTVHTTMQYNPDQLVFGRNSIINQPHDVEWEIIMEQNHIHKGNKRKNCNWATQRETRSYKR